MVDSRLSELSHPQRDRLAYIELRLWFVGEIGRQALTERFAIRSAAATRDLALYRELAPDNIAYDSRSKVYRTGRAFAPLFEFPVERVLAWVAEGFGDGDPISSQTGIACAVPRRLAQPNLNTLAAVTRAISQGCPLRITYHSVSSGRSRREIVPHALIDTGLRWHVRAFDRKTKSFRDFVITRILSPEVLQDGEVGPAERPGEDAQWTRIVEVQLVPHPDRPHPQITEMDYSMRDGAMTVRVRAAMSGYALRSWSVDCSTDHRLDGPEFRLWLRNPLALYDVESARLAPGYSPPESGMSTR